MTRNEELRATVTDLLQRESIAYDHETSEFTEELKLDGTVDGKHVSVHVIKYPAGENPGTYAGAPRWSVEVSDEHGHAIGRHSNPEESLEMAFSVVDWDSVRDALA